VEAGIIKLDNYIIYDIISACLGGHNIPKEEQAMNYKDYKKAALAGNPELRKEYEALAPQYYIIDAVIAARIEQQLTQAELAKRADTKQSNISRFESGNYNPSVEFLQKIAGALDKQLEITLR
jgi:DNA-binding XRE family transcriptional regulator